ncbi:MAG: succinate dehydrogenase assembly factor 2 [Betaproteobacteria bacterium]
MNTTGSTDHGEASLSATDMRLKRLYWRCRRGTRELDALLGGWLQTHKASRDEAQWTAFETLLDQQDPQLWDWLTGHGAPARDDWRAIVTEIRATATFQAGQADPESSPDPVPAP